MRCSKELLESHDMSPWLGCSVGCPHGELGPSLGDVTRSNVDLNSPYCEYTSCNGITPIGTLPELGCIVYVGLKH